MSPRRPETEHPQALHLGRLARVTPELPLELPQSGDALRALHLTRKYQDDEVERWYVCLSGQVLVDLPFGGFVHLHPQEACRIPEGTPRTLTPVGEATVLIIEIENIHAS